MAGCMLSYRQNLHFVKTVIVPAATYAFPLTYLTLADLAKLDRLYSRICKQALGLPTCPTTALVFEDRARCGMGMPSLTVNYTTMVSESVVYSLLDNGQLGMITQALLYLQNSIVGSVSENDQTRKALRQVKHYHLARKLAILQASDLKLRFPNNMKSLEGNMLAEQMAALKHQGEDLGVQNDIPADVCMPLLQLGYHSFADLLGGQRRPTLISTTDLCRTHGHLVKRGHKLALNRLTVLVNEHDLSELTLSKAKAYSSVAPIDSSGRVVNNPIFTELCCVEHSGMRAIRNQERSALRLLRSHVQRQASHTRDPSETQSSPVRSEGTAEGITEQTRRRPTGKRTDSEGHVLQRMQVIDDCTWDPLYNSYEQKKLHYMSRRSSRGARRYTRKLKEGQPPWSLEDKAAYIDWMTKHSKDNRIITPLYNKFDEAEGVLARQWCKSQQQLLVQWRPTPCRVRHIPLHEEQGYKVHSTAPYHGNEIDADGEEVCTVTWEPKWELADSFCHADNPEQIRLAAEFAQECSELGTIHMAKDNHVRQDAHKTNIEKQGSWVRRECRTKRPLSYQPQLRKYIHINAADTINPDQDIVTDGAYTLGLADAEMTDEGSLVNVYNDEGKVVSTITEKRLKTLYTAFSHTQAAAPEIIQGLQATSFVHEVAKLTLRYQVRKGDKDEKLPDQSGIPDEYMQALISSLDLQCERFASPLNFNPGVKQYYSLYEQDKVFGANLDAYSKKWEGASQANPPHDAQAMEKAVRWAILSADQSHVPTLTAFMLASSDATGYMKWLSHPMVRQLGCIRREYIKFKTPDYWKTGKLYTKYSKQDVMLFVVGNQAGLEEFLDVQKLRAHIAQASLCHGKSSYVIEDLHCINEDLCTDCEIMRGLYEPKHFAEAAHAEGTKWDQGFAPESEDIRGQGQAPDKEV